MTISIDDRQLVESYQAGDTHAFADLVEAHGPSLMGHALRRLGDRAAAEDAVQETFVRAYRALARFDGDYRVGPWLHRILANVCHDEGNRRRREAEKFDRFAADPFSAELAPGVEDELGLDVDDDGLASALQSLPPNYRQALDLRFVQELPYEEVARVAGVSEQNARARVSRARSAARAALRGVAALPLLVVPALRRTESVAAAAGHSDAVRAATDAVVASAPAATPIVTKAVIGISVVAAMAAPSSGPMGADQGRSLNVAAPVVAEEVAVPESVGSTPVVVTEAPAAGRSSVAPLDPGVAAAEPGSVDAPGPDASGVPAPASGSGPVALPAGGQPSGGPGSPPVAGVDDEAPPPPAVRSGGSLTLSDLSLTAAGPRLDVVGSASLVLGDRTLSGTVSGRLSHTDQVDVRRYTVALVLTLADGSTVDLRVQAQGRALDGQAELALTEVTAFQLAGAFRATGPASVGLVESGTATGTLDLAAQRLELRLG